VRFGSVCSGIEAASAAWGPLGWKGAWLSEIEPFANAVLAHRYPDVPNLGDMTKLGEREEYRESKIDVLVGGTPCQSFSVAGFRKGLRDPRGALALTFCEIAKEKRPRWVVWENVTGVLSSNKGRDFGSLLGALAYCGYGLAYRVLNAKFFGVAQSRRRVFLVGHLGDDLATKVLFDGESRPWDAAPIPEPNGPMLLGGLEVCYSGVEPSTGDTSRCLLASGTGRYNPTAETFVTEEDLGVRRLTPVEWERLQGFPEDYTLVPYRGRPAEQCPYSPRQKTLGNSIAVPVLRWIGGRIAFREALTTVVRRLTQTKVKGEWDERDVLRDVAGYLSEQRRGCASVRGFAAQQSEEN
jgi:DNA (cytosine-5)-methyltransferase 1